MHVKKQNTAVRCRGAKIKNFGEKITFCFKYNNLACKMISIHLIFALVLWLIVFGFHEVDAATSDVYQRADVNDSLPVVYQLFTRKNLFNYQELRLHDLSALQSSNYNPQLPTKIYAPGWNDNGSIAYSTRDEYLLRDDCNFIIIYWPDVQQGGGNGVFVVRTTQMVANHTGAFIDFLIENGTPINAFHLIGHSAGTHLAGGAGAAVSYGKIPRITGLDPADGTWDLNNTDTRLDISDAEFVDIIHTNGKKLSSGGIGFGEALGHVDFYVNGGEKQPGCTSLDLYTCCSHCRSVDLFAESINTPVGFVSLRCDSWEAFHDGSCSGNDKELMGDTVNLKARGVFYVDTNPEAPWAMGDVN